MSSTIARIPSGQSALSANIAKFRRLYALARTLERDCGSEPGREAAREIAVLALDMLAEARAGR